MRKGTYDIEKHKHVLNNMDLHETIKFSDELYVTKVIGGWIYTTCMRNDDDQRYVGLMSSVFVPFKEN